MTNNNAYPEDWDERRKSVYRRDNYTCQRCGQQSGPHIDSNGIKLHAHHKMPISKGGGHEMSNLETLCERCHNSVHDHAISTEEPQSTRPTIGESSSTTDSSDNELDETGPLSKIEQPVIDNVRETIGIAKQGARISFDISDERIESLLMEYRDAESDDMRAVRHVSAQILSEEGVRNPTQLAYSTYYAVGDDGAGEIDFYSIDQASVWVTVEGKITELESSSHYESDVDSVGRIKNGYGRQIPFTVRQNSSEVELKVGGAYRFVNVFTTKQNNGYAVEINDVTNIEEQAAPNKIDQIRKKLSQFLS